MIIHTVINVVALLVVLVFVKWEMKGLKMSLSEDLQEVRANLIEAGQEIVAKITDLESQIASNDVDPQLISDVKTLAKSLADIVPNAPEESEPSE